MTGPGEWLSGFGLGGAALAFAVAALMGLRHATDPDHLTAVSTLVLSDRRHGARAAAWHGLAWGAGHGVTLFLFGLPIVLFRGFLPTVVQSLAEAAIGAVVVALAVRLLLRWKRGYFHSHAHTHDGVEHAHPHVHEVGGVEGGSHVHAAAHDHAHAADLGATPRHAFAVGLLHGIGGSAGAGALLIAAVADGAAGTAALAIYAGATALAMALVSAGFGQALAWGKFGQRYEAVIPAFAAFGVLFGVWYAVAAF